MLATSSEPQMASTGSVSMDDYLEQIWHLIEENGTAKATELAQRLDLSQPSVSTMLKRLDQEGWLINEKYRDPKFTKKGKTMAEAIVKRHKVLTNFLRLFHLPENVIYNDVEGMEHYISLQTLTCVEALTKCLKGDPKFLNHVVKELQEQTANNSEISTN